MKCPTWIIDSLMGLWEWCWSWSLTATMARRSSNRSISVSVWHVITSLTPTNLHAITATITSNASTTYYSEQHSREYKSPQVELPASQGTLRAELNQWVKLSACLLWETLSNYTFDIFYYGDVTWEGLIGSKSERARWDGTALEGIHSSIHPRRR